MSCMLKCMNNSESKDSHLYSEKLTNYLIRYFPYLPIALSPSSGQVQGMLVLTVPTIRHVIHTSQLCSFVLYLGPVPISFGSSESMSSFIMLFWILNLHPIKSYIHGNL